MLVLSCLSGTEGFDRTTKPHVGMVRDAGSTPAVSTHPVRVQRVYRSASYGKRITVLLAHKYGYRGLQTRCLLNLWQRESNFRPDAFNKTSGAAGIPQILGMDPSTTVPDQVRRGLRYIAHRYGSPCSALAHHNRHNWY